jgi:hypothetical protein
VKQQLSISIREEIAAACLNIIPIYHLLQQSDNFASEGAIIDGGQHHHVINASFFSVSCPFCS